MFELLKRICELRIEAKIATQQHFKQVRFNCPKLLSHCEQIFGQKMIEILIEFQECECHNKCWRHVGAFDENVQTELIYFCFFAAFDWSQALDTSKPKLKREQSLWGQTCVIFKAVIISWHPKTTTTTAAMAMTSTPTPTLTIMPIKRNQQLNTENGLWTQNISEEDDISALLTWMADGNDVIESRHEEVFYFKARNWLSRTAEFFRFWFQTSDLGLVSRSSKS